jgi:hypothetical protein
MPFRHAATLYYAIISFAIFAIAADIFAIISFFDITPRRFSSFSFLHFH